MRAAALTADEAMALAREVLLPIIPRPSFPWMALPPGFDDACGYALWNETAWPFKRDRETLTRQLEAYRNSPVEATS